MHESGRMIRSALEWLMSRSCQSATFSSAATAFPRITRASPLNRSPVIGIALVRHGGTSLLSFAKKFFDLENFRALQMPEFGCPAIDARRNESERG